MTIPEKERWGGVEISGRAEIKNDISAQVSGVEAGALRG